VLSVRLSDAKHLAGPYRFRHFARLRVTGGSVEPDMI